MFQRSHFSWFIVFIVAVAFGHSFIRDTWKGNSYLNAILVRPDSRGRDPAAIRRLYDFSGLEGSALESASKKRLLSGARLVPNKDGLKIELGHFVFSDKNGQRDFACNVFDRVELVFLGQGVAVSGEQARLTVTGPCQYKDDVNQISAIEVPLKKLLKETPGDLDLVYSEFPELHISTEHAIDFWPEEWELIEISLKNSQGSGSSMRVLSEDIRAWYQGPMTVEWNESLTF